MSDYAEKLRGLVDGFDYELCEECGRDLDRHVIAPDILGNPHAYCREDTVAACEDCEWRTESDASWLVHRKAGVHRGVYGHKVVVEFNQPTKRGRQS